MCQGNRSVICFVVFTSFLKIGFTCAIFHSAGSELVLKDLLKMIDSGSATDTAHSFRSVGAIQKMIDSGSATNTAHSFRKCRCNPSGPGDFSPFSFCNFFYTFSGLQSTQESS